MNIVIANDGTINVTPPTFRSKFKTNLHRKNKQ